MKIKVLPVLLVLPFLLLSAGSVLAIGGAPSGIGGKPTSLPSGQQRGLIHLTEGKLRACQAIEGALKQRMVHLMQLVVTMEGKFDAIAQRVEDYYTGTVVPSGKTVSNYNALTADIQTQKTAVQTAITTAQANSSSFDCAGTNPKGVMTQFRLDMQGVLKALQNYRMSIKNLIVAVRSVTGTTESAGPSPSASASPVPTATP